MLPRLKLFGLSEKLITVYFIYKDIKNNLNTPELLPTKLNY